MKYMGSKSAMLQNGLGDLLRSEIPQAERVIDLFTGSGAVAWFAAEVADRPVIAFDLQRYAAVMAGAVIERAHPLDAKQLVRAWVERARARTRTHARYSRAITARNGPHNTATWVRQARDLCSDYSAGLVWNCYGGHYFSPDQAIVFDSLRDALPDELGARSTCLAALLTAASRCAAAPGHTAQPFQPTRRAARFIREAWLRDPFAYAEAALTDIAPRYARSVGRAEVGDAVATAARLRSSDLVFIDPPYTDVQYSRFYHVLETIAKGEAGEISGVGRYPPPEERPVSEFSLKTGAAAAFSQLLRTLATVGSTAIVTFPHARAGNGLSGSDVTGLAEGFFDVTRSHVKTRFSTLGGNNKTRKARRPSKELILVLRPKKAARYSQKKV